MSTVNGYIQAFSSFDILDQSTINMIALMEKEIGNEYSSTDLRNKAIALLTMHNLTIFNSNNNAQATGTIQSEKEGDLSIKYGFSGKTKFKDDFLSQTQYGLMLLSLNKGQFFKPRTRANSWLT